MTESLVRNRQLCLDQAQGFIDAAKRVGAKRFPHIVYHLSLLALEEVGKASMISAKLATGGGNESRWVDKAFESHRRKLQWAIWSPVERIDPRDFEAARDFAERAHAMRLASLYTDAHAELTDLPASDMVSTDDAHGVLELARARLNLERVHGTPDPDAHSTDDVLRWFLDTVADASARRQLFSKTFIARYHALANDARAWVTWAREEFVRRDQEAEALLQVELSKPAAPMEEAKPKWRLNAIVYTPSHSLRPKVLQRWNERIDVVQLLWSGKKDQFTLQLTLNDNAPLSSLSGRATHLSKLVVACINIGSIGYFWFERPGFEQRMFTEIRDLENGGHLEFEPKESFWGNNRAVALTDEHIEHASRCMMAFAPLTEAEAVPIFRPYYDGLALMAKSDTFYSFDMLARRAFVASLAGALARYGGWDGKQETFRTSYDEAFAPIMPEQAHRDQMFQSLTPQGDPEETPLVNLRSAKQLADLYLILVGQRTWNLILDRGADVE
jgi:AbiV family abortive infection protein